MLIEPMSMVSIIAFPAPLIQGDFMYTAILALALGSADGCACSGCAQACACVACHACHGRCHGCHGCNACNACHGCHCGCFGRWRHRCHCHNYCACACSGTTCACACAYAAPAGGESLTMPKGKTAAVN